MKNNINQLFYVEDIMKDIQTLTMYLTLSEKHSVSRRFGCTTQVLSGAHIDGPHIYILKSYMDGEEIGAGTFDPTINDLRSFIRAAHNQKPSNEYATTFQTKWDEIVAITGLDMGSNRMRQEKTAA